MCILAIISAVKRKVTEESTVIVAVCMKGKSSKVLGVLLQIDAKLSRAQLLITRRTHI